MASSPRRLFPLNSRYAVLLLLVVLVIAALFFFSEVLLPFALAIFLSYLLAPLIARMNRIVVMKWTVPRGAAILVVYAVILGLIVLSGFYLFPRFYSEVNRMVHTFPNALQDIERNFVVPFEVKLNNWLAEIIPLPVMEENGIDSERPEPDGGSDSAQSGMPASPAPAPNGGSEAGSAWKSLVDDYTYVVKRVDENSFEVIPKRKTVLTSPEKRQTFSFNKQLSGAFSQFRSGLEENILEFIILGRRFIRSLVGSFFTLFLVLMISGFILLDPKRIHDFIRSVIPSQYAASYDDWLGRLDFGLSGVVRGQAIICLVNGTLTGIGIAILGVPFVATLSVIAAVFSLIPIFGVLISSIPILLMALTVSFTTALLALIWILFIHFLEANFLNPKILGESAKIHPVLIVFALLVGEHFAGVIGALLAVPIFSLIQNSFLFLKHKAESLDTAS